jgi:GNAT superfamily N-acetyltransferase
MIREIERGETALAYPAMRALRTHLESEEAFVRRVDDAQRPEGYRLAGAFSDDEPHALAVAGFRVLRTLFAGDSVYVDDLSTLPDARGRGYGRGLVDWMLEEARRLGCTELHLDSAVGPEREDAHRLYFNARLRIVSYHFSRPV